MPETNENEELQELYEHFRFKSDAGQKPLRIDKFLYNKLENTSRSKIQAAADAGLIYVNGKVVKSNYKVKPLDEVSIMLTYPPREIELIPENIPLDIIYEDNELIVINKKPGMVVHPGHGNYTGTMVNALAYHLQGKSELFVKGSERPGLVHRIDKNTSGIIVVAKTEFALNHLARQFFEHTTDRTYQALVWGSFKNNEQEGTITGNIGRSLKNRLQMDVFPNGEYGKHAVTHYKVLQNIGYVSLIECKLETGRTHQIRVHLKHIGHPLFNDERYGGDQILRGTTFTKYKQFVNNCFKILPRHALHAKSLGFTHPKTGKRMFFDSELPDDMKLAISKWNNYISGRNEMD
jgi:23S rRNA pseudouridine1911/1915/1917 synthase